MANLMASWLLTPVVMGLNACSPVETAVTRIAFGSCGYHDEPQPVLSLAAQRKPDAFIFLGDNIYGDTDNMDTLRAKYSRWMNSTDYMNLKKATRILATWDDHDYGRNDAGKEYPFKEASKEIFLDMFNEQSNTARKSHPGIYDVQYLQAGNRKVQILLLDVRSFRNGLLYFQKDRDTLPSGFFYTPDYKIHTSTDSTLLGDAQWSWLEAQLQQPADLRLICSGSQFGITYNGYEAWANFPHEQNRMLQLIKSTGAKGVMFLTGDVHYAEISKLTWDGPYPIYDCTASGITSTWHFATQNKNRIEGPVMDNHFGLLTIQWTQDPLVTMEIIDKTNNQRIEHTFPLREISR